MLQAFYQIRKELQDSLFTPNVPFISGTISVTRQNIDILRNLESGSYVRDVQINGQVVNLAIFPLERLPASAKLILYPVQLHYYENLSDLIRRARTEPDSYILDPEGQFQRADVTNNVSIQNFRLMLSAQEFLRKVSDLSDEAHAIFLTPDQLEVELSCQAEDIKPLLPLDKLKSELADDSIERDQRLALFKRSLGEHLHSVPADRRFGHFLANLDAIYETYHRDFLLWIGQAFNALEKQFEERRLKFVTDLNGILSSIQTSILAVPLAGIVVVDKYDLSRPLRDFFLFVSVGVLSLVAGKLLGNQALTLNALDKALQAIEADYKTKEPTRWEEFAVRLEGVIQQAARIRSVLTLFRIGLWVILILVGTAWLASLAKWTARFDPFARMSLSTAFSHALPSPKAPEQSTNIAPQMPTHSQTSTNAASPSSDAEHKLTP